MNACSRTKWYATIFYHYIIFVKQSTVWPKYTYVARIRTENNQDAQLPYESLQNVTEIHICYMIQYRMWLKYNFDVWFSTECDWSTYIFAVWFSTECNWNAYPLHDSVQNVTAVHIFTIACALNTYLHHESVKMWLKYIFCTMNQYKCDWSKYLLHELIQLWLK